MGQRPADAAAQPEPAGVDVGRTQRQSRIPARSDPADGAGWDVIDRRFSGSEILLELRAGDGERLWVEAGSRVRHLSLGDRVSVSLRDIDTVAFTRRGAGASEAAGSSTSPAATTDTGRPSRSAR